MMMWSVWKLICDICGQSHVAVIPCGCDGEWPIESAGAECPGCGNMACYPVEGE